MRGSFVSFVAGFAVAVHAVAGCGSDKAHPPFASETCTNPPCKGPGLLGGNAANGSGGSGGTDAGTADASSSNCFVEVNSGLTLCASADGCDFVLDRTRFPDCGFIASSSGLDLECVCPQTSTASLQLQVCPVAAMATCANVKNAAANAGSETAICTPNTVTASSSNCRDVNSVVPAGSGGASNCDPACVQSCSGNPTCVTACCRTP